MSSLHGLGFSMKRYRYGFLMSIIAVLSYGGATGWAQITLDGSLGPEGPLDGPHYEIPAEVGQSRGANLFHSFGEFNVHHGESATFTGPVTIENIVARVTGGYQSMIDGELRSNIDGANLFLLNPHGVLFGENATLDVRGSFHVSTSDYLRLTDGTRFFAYHTEDSSLSVAPPAAFGFLGNRLPMPITVRGSQLNVPEGETLSIVGGDVIVQDSNLSAPSGRVYLASIASAGEVIPGLEGQSPSLEITSVERFGEVRLDQGTRIQASGERGGAVVIRSGRLLMDRSKIIMENQGTVDADIGIDIAVDEDIVLTHEATIESRTTGTGRGGDVKIEAENLALKDGSYIDTNTRGQGQGGGITVQVADTLSISGRGAFSSGIYSETVSGPKAGGSLMIAASRLKMSDTGKLETLTTGRGRGGDIKVDADHITLTGGARIATNTTGLFDGDAGDIEAKAREQLVIAGRDEDDRRSGIVSLSTFSSSGRSGNLKIKARLLKMNDSGLIQSVSVGDGEPGHIEVWADHLVMTRGASIDNSLLGESSNAGQVTVIATGSISISGQDDQGFRSGIFSEASDSHAGSIVISAPVLEIRNSGIISTRTLRSGRGGAITLEVDRLSVTNGGEISSEAFGDGGGGDISIDAVELELHHGANITSSTSGVGPGGNITLMVDDLRLTNGARVQAASVGMLAAPGSDVTAGDAGEIVITATRLIMQNGSTVATTSREADGGNIRIAASAVVLLQDQSAITSSVNGGEETVGGNIEIDAELVALASSDILANAFAGRGGNIRIATDGFITDSLSRVDASSELGIDGTVEIQALTDVSGDTNPLSEEFLQIAALLRDRCAARLQEGNVGSFVVSERDGLPAQPGEVLPSRFYFVEPDFTDALTSGIPSRRTTAPHPNDNPNGRFRVSNGARMGLSLLSDMTACTRR